ncbi:hypothetical protein [Streptosporangium sp. H16]|uniref:hypothetical protein n=1 Tax=Streptosporangium sp. H16 TaxID=3444184 RepID=UPI003F797F9A
MLNRFVGVDDLKMTVQYAGGGGDFEGSRQVPGVSLRFAANHDKDCVDTHAANHPEGEHWLGDVQQADAIHKFPYAPLFWSSPACPDYSNAKGVKRTFDKENQLALWGGELTDEQKKAVRSRALMEETVTYLRHCQEVHGKPVLGFGIENVPQARLWAYWDRWIDELKKLGYPGGRLFAVNSMHIQPRLTLPSMQSRNRLLFAAVHESVGREPDWDKWMRPHTYCPRHEGWIQAVQSWKKLGQDMGVYGIKTGQYVYRCPLHSCRGQIVEPAVLTASHCIDWTDLGTPIGDRPKTAKKPRGMEEATLQRIEIGAMKQWGAFLTPTGGTWNNDPYSLDETIRTVTTRENTGLVVPLEGRDKPAASTDEPIRTQTTRRETGVAFLPPLVTPMRGGGDKHQARRADVSPVHAVTAGGNHHGLIIPPEFETGPEPLLMSYYGKGAVLPVSDTIGTIPTRDRWALLTPDGRLDIDKIRFRMLKVPELKRAQSLPAGYILTPKDQRTQMRLIGNAVPPLMSEVLMCAVVEAIRGADIERFVTSV